MTDVVVPKLNNNDSHYLLVEWVAKDGAQVRPGEVLALIETSKTVEELEAETEGVLRHLIAEGAECAPGQAIARLGEDAAAAEPAAQAAAAPATACDVVITAPARLLMEKLGIGEDRVRALGKKVIRREDVAALAEPQAPAAAPAPAPAPAAEAGPAASPTAGPAAADAARDEAAEDVLVLSRAQRRIGEVVSRTHQEMPAAFTVVKVDVEEALRLSRALIPKLRTLVGLPDLLVKAVAGLVERFPVMFGTPLGPDRLRRAATAHVGVTMDAGKGLFVPVVHDATGLPLREICRTLVKHRMTAVYGGFREEDLSGANIVVTLHNESTVTLAIPIVFPGQVCALSLAAPQREVVPAEDGFEVRHTVHLGLAYDHRYANGRDAVQFLDAIREALESPAALAEDAG